MHNAHVKQHEKNKIPQNAITHVMDIFEYIIRNNDNNNCDERKLNYMMHIAYMLFTENAYDRQTARSLFSIHSSINNNKVIQFSSIVVAVYFGFFPIQKL